MTGFTNTSVAHMYGNKHFALGRAEMSTSQSGAVVLDLQSKCQREKSPVHITLAPADAIRIGEALIERGRAVLPAPVQ